MNRRDDLRDLYTPFSVAKKEIWRRWNDKQLRKKVEDFLKGDIPDFLSKKPKAVMARYIATPLTETIRFLELAKKIELTPVVYEHKDDIFVAGNLDKYCLCKMFFYNGIGKKGGLKIDAQKIINFDGAEGKKIKHIETIWGMKLIDFHHEIFKKIEGSAECEIHDVNGWYKRNGKVPKNYYLYHLALFISHGILFENFLLNEDEFDFTHKVVLENIEKLKNIFHVKPLIVPIAPFKSETDLFWWCYPIEFKKIIEKDGFQFN